MTEYGRIHADASRSGGQPVTDEAMKPVAWIIENAQRGEKLLSEKPLPRGADELGWTETPLYTPPTPTPSAMVEAMARAIATSRGSDIVQWFHRNDAQAAATVIAEAMAAKDAEIARLSTDNEGLREMLRVVENPDQQLCCSGHECGCMGSTVGQYAAWAFKDEAAKDAQLAELRAEIEALGKMAASALDCGQMVDPRDICAALGSAEG